MQWFLFQSLCRQTTLPKRVTIVDDGSTDEESVSILNEIEVDGELSVQVRVIRQTNRGVSAARNAGICETEVPFVLVLDGDDNLEPSFIEEVGKILSENPSMVAASSWMHTFGVLASVVRPTGGDITAFLSHNCCPTTHIFRRSAWQKCGGYDESMRDGFEDWDFFLNMLETTQGAKIGIVKQALINYRTAPVSSNIKSMEKRLELMRYIMEKHIGMYQEHMIETMLGMETISMSRLYGWESEMIHAKLTGKPLNDVSKA